MGAVEGCVNQSLFNGLVRLKVLSVTAMPIVDSPSLGTKKDGFMVNLEIRNGSTTPNSLSSLGFGGLGNGAQAQLTYDDASVLQPRRGTLDVGRTLAPGAAMQATLEFIPDDAHIGKQPNKFLLLKTNNPAGLRFNVPDPSFRVKLNCP